MRALKIAGGSIAAIVILLLSQISSQLICDRITNVVIYDIAQSLLYVGFAITLSAIFSRYVLKMSLRDLGLRFKRSTLKWIIIGILLPMVVTTFYLIGTEGELARNLRVTNIPSTIVYAIFVVGIGGGVVEEVVFRGLIMKTIEKYWCKTASVLLPAVVFGALHLTNMDSWNVPDAIQLVIAGTAVGIMFALIADRANSIWASAIVHSLWNTIIIGGILEIGSPQYGMSINSIWQYMLHSQNMLLTGGQFGIEASLPSTICYIILIVFTAGKKKI